MKTNSSRLQRASEQILAADTHNHLWKPFGPEVFANVSSYPQSPHVQYVESQLDYQSLSDQCVHVVFAYVIDLQSSTKSTESTIQPCYFTHEMVIKDGRKQLKEDNSCLSNAYINVVKKYLHWIHLKCCVSKVIE